MSILRYTANKDNTISSAFKMNLSSRGTLSNMGSSDILEMFAIFGQSNSSSLEQSRVLVQFPINEILADRNSGKLPASGSVTFKLKMFNAEHNQTVPEKVTCVARPIVKPWNEGGGLDMESFLDEGASNWLSASTGVPWTNQGGDFLSASYINTSPAPLSYEQYLETGIENLDVDITELVEQFLINEAGNSTPASGSIIFNDDNIPSSGDKIKIYAYNGEHNTFLFTNTTGSSGTTHYVKIEATARATATNFIDTVNVSSSIKDYVAATGTDNDLTCSLSQRAGTFYGNTIISSSIHVTGAAVTNFTGGTGALNYGLILKLSGSQEDGSLSRSYYTKKFFARSSHHFLEKPVIEAQWDSSVKDDRGNIIKSSSLAPAADNLNNIYLYNRIRGRLVDIPSTASNLVVQFVPSVGSTPVDVVSSVGATENYVTASKHSTGIYKAQFAYAGNEKKLNDIWSKHQAAAAATATLMVDSANFGTLNLNLENSDGTSHAITASALGAGTPSTATAINTSLIGNANDAATQLKASLDAAVTAGTLKMTVSAISNNDSGAPRVVALTQSLSTAAGNTTIGGTLISRNKIIVNNTAQSTHGSLKFTGGITESVTELFTGSALTINSDTSNSYYEIPRYDTKITNLKSAYDSKETATFRIYTRNKNWQPNLYTVANQSAPVNNIRDAYYRVKRVSDNMTIINYSTSSATSYSSLSYDISGSYFDLDMSILEPNYLYEISFLYKDGTDYVEQKEKFKFRVDP